MLRHLAATFGRPHAIGLAAALAVALPLAAHAAERQTAPAKPRQETWTLDQIRFPRSAPAEAVSALAPDHSMEAVEATLRRYNVAFDRVRVTLDTRQLPQAVLDQVNALPPSEPFVIPLPTVLTVNVILSRSPQ